MTLSSRDAVRAFYDSSADSYNAMMNEEITLPVYDEVLSGLAERIVSMDGPVLDTSCGSGQMLERFRNEHAQQRRLLGLDLSSQMVEIAQERLGETAVIWQGDMRDLGKVSDDVCAAIISFFSLHHIDSAELVDCFAEWQRAMLPAGQLVAAVWEGEGTIDYGEHADIVARRYTQRELAEALNAAGFRVDQQAVRPVEGFEMDAVYIAATKLA